MRIISGKYKNRKIVVSDEDGFRPTTGKVKEAIFSILTSGQFIIDDKSIFENAVIMDLFAGSGAFSFESLSRGASKAIIVELNQTNLNLIKENAIDLGAVNDIIIIKSDAADLPKAKIQCDIIFIDPPYNKGLLTKSLNSLIEQNWLKNGSIIIAETDKLEKNNIHEDYSVLIDRNYGKTKILVLEYKNLNE